MVSKHPSKCAITLHITHVTYNFPCSSSPWGLNRIRRRSGETNPLAGTERPDGNANFSTSLHERRKMDENRTYFVQVHGSDTDSQKDLPREKDTYMELVGSRDKSLVSWAKRSRDPDLMGCLGLRDGGGDATPRKKNCGKERKTMTEERLIVSAGPF